MSARGAPEGRVADLAAAFAARGRALRTDLLTRTLYSTDASAYRVVPAAVFVPRTADDLALAVEICGEHGVPLAARGAGTSLSGQSLCEGVQIDCSHLTQVGSIDPERRLARVEPGVTWWRLDAAARAHGLELGPDPATKRVCTIGGMIGSNAGGTHSVVYGATVDHVHALEVVLADGTLARLEASRDGTMATTGLPPGIARALEDVRARARGMLGPQFSTLARRGSGYQLEHLCADFPHAGKLLAGSDGTLGLVTEAEVTLVPLPAARVLAVVGFDDMHAALAAVPALAATGPCAVELVSASMLAVARRDPYHRPAVADVDPSLGSLLFVEYQGDSVAEAAAGFDRMQRALREPGGARAIVTATDPDACARRWAIREAGVGALSAVASGPLLPQAFVEDTTVTVERLPAYIREFDGLFAAHGMEAVWYGHASTGLIHVRPFLDMTSSGDLARLESLMGDAVDLVRAYAGDLCGEHGNGISRTYWNERLFGPELYAEMKAVKRAFDPGNLLNPGKVVDGGHPLASLRYGADYARRRYRPSVSFDDQGGFASAAERCYGAGICRKRDLGTMCPPAAATGLEEHSTRARANLLRAVVSGALEWSALSGPDAREVMETCVGCKACKVECPARVDVARLKVEWADMVRRREGATLLARSIANLRALAAAGSLVAPFANRVLSSERLKRRLGVAPERALPALASRPLWRRLERGTSETVLYPDCFTTYFEPEAGEALARLAEAAGRRVALARVPCCGRVMLSEGYVEKARRSARRGVVALRRTKGPILFIEPSCMSAVVDDWPHLVGDAPDVAARCRLADGFVADVARGLSFRPGGRAIVHAHCHQKALFGMTDTLAALRLAPGLEVEVLDAGCCGMAGSFGYLAARQDLSRAMGERVLGPAVRAAPPDTAVIATGISCRHQVAHLTGRAAAHPLVFLLEWLG